MIPSTGELEGGSARRMNGAYPSYAVVSVGLELVECDRMPVGYSFPQQSESTR